VVYAVTRDRSIGIDVEYIRPMPEAEQIVKSFFSVYENNVFQHLPLCQKQLAFFNCWTRKEAFVKAIGDGLSLPLDRFDVSLIPGEPARLLGIKGDRSLTRWSLQDLTLDPGYVAALAVEGQSWNLSCWEWEEKG
jgi:4'-phosphopantetheinyl transferase